MIYLLLVIMFLHAALKVLKGGLHKQKESQTLFICLGCFLQIFKSHNHHDCDEVNIVKWGMSPQNEFSWSKMKKKNYWIF